MIRTKMVVNDIRQHRGVRRDPETGTYNACEVHKVTFDTCAGESRDQQMHTDVRPSGALEIDVIDPERSEFFEVGKSYYLEFFPAE